jgi:hypothetical protein
LKTKSPTWQQFAWQWLVACIVAKFLEIIIDGLAGSWGAATGNSDSITYLIFLILAKLISGTLGGIAQLLVLRQWLGSMRRWVFATSLGSAIAIIAINRLWAMTIVPPSPSGIIGFLDSFASTPTSFLPKFLFDGIYGGGVGLLQWVVLRTKVPQSGWWVVVGGVGMLVYGLLVTVLQHAIGSSGIDVYQSASNPIFWAIATISFLPYVGITGRFLYWSFHHKFSE